MDGITVISGTKEDDVLAGTSSSDVLLGGKGDDTLDGGDGSDLLLGSKGDDTLDGGAGSDIILAGKGDDFVNYTFSENADAYDYYDGGKGFDTLQLTLTSAELLLAQDDIAAFYAYLNDGGKIFQFQSFDLTVRNFEALVINEIVFDTAMKAADDSFTTDEDTPVVLDLLANDSDAQGDSCTAVIVDGPENGTLALNDDGTFTYTPNADFFGKDSFTYKASDGTLDSNLATVALEVAPVNDAPVAEDDAFSTDEDTPAIGGNLLMNDTDIEDGRPALVNAVNGLAANVGETIMLNSGALLTVNADGSFVYDPNGQFEHLAAGESAADCFTYVGGDAEGAASNTATVNLTITGVDDAPAAIRVAVVGGTQSILDATVGQLADSSIFNFEASGILVTTILDWQNAFDNYDVVVIGDDGASFAYLDTGIFSSLGAFVDAGGGVVTTGVFAKEIFSMGYGSDADYISPVAASATGDFLYVAPGSTITISDPSHPIADGISAYAAQGYHEVAAAVDASATVLAVDAYGRAAIAYDEVGLGRTVYVGSAHMASDITFQAYETRLPDSAVDHLFEEAVAWAAGSGGSVAAGLDSVATDVAPVGSSDYVVYDVIPVTLDTADADLL
jgi:VCBS repeat-containing protein